MLGQSLLRSLRVAAPARAFPTSFASLPLRSLSTSTISQSPDSSSSYRAPDAQPPQSFPEQVAAPSVTEGVRAKARLLRSKAEEERKLRSRVEEEKEPEVALL